MAAKRWRVAVPLILVVSGCIVAAYGDPHGDHTLRAAGFLLTVAAVATSVIAASSWR